MIPQRLVLLVSGIAACSHTNTAVAPSIGSWKTTFEDNFDGEDLDITKWTISNGTQDYDGHQAQFVPDAISVSNGHLIITTKWAPATVGGKHYNMTSGWIDSKSKMVQNITNPTRFCPKPLINPRLLRAYGPREPLRYEARIKMPNQNATGAWPAWWLLPQSACWPMSGEIDIVEWYAGGHYQHNKVGNPSSISQTYHFGYSCLDDASHYGNDSQWFPNMSCYSCPIIDFTADFHSFGVEINGTHLRWYVDGVTTYVHPTPALCVTDPGFTWGETAYAPFLPVFGILNVAVRDQASTDWWIANPKGIQTLVDSVQIFEFVPNA